MDISNLSLPSIIQSVVDSNNPNNRTFYVDNSRITSIEQNSLSYIDVDKESNQYVLNTSIGADNAQLQQQINSLNQAIGLSSSGISDSSLLKSMKAAITPTKFDSVQNTGVFVSENSSFENSPDVNTIQHGVGVNAESTYGITTSLMWPNDLINNSSYYGGEYTVFFISEHEDNLVGNLKSSSQNSVDFLGASRKTSDMQEIAKNNAEAIQNYSTLGTGLRRYAMIKTILPSGGLAATAALGLASTVSNNGSLEQTADQIKSGLSNLYAKYNSGGVSGVVDEAQSQLSDISSTLMAGSTLGSQLSQNKTEYKRLNVCIALPTPHLSTQTNVNWDNQDLNIQKMLITQGSKIFGDVKELFSNGNLNGLKTFASDAGNVLDVAAQSADQSVLGGLFGSNALSVISGKSINTRAEMLFKDTEFRTFEFTYRMFARNKKETQEIQNIIRVFRYHALPSVTRDKLLYTYPSRFDIVHYYNDKVNPHMPVHTTCVCTNINVDYGGDSQTIREDGSPVEITLTLGFKEIAKITREDVSKGY